MSVSTHNVSLVRKTIVTLGLDRMARFWMGGLGCVIMLHRVRTIPPDTWEANPGLFVSPVQLEILITTLRREGYTLVTLDEACARMRHGDRRRFACLTFDDGYADNQHILPVLEQTRTPAMIYVTTGTVDRQVPLWDICLEHILRSQTELVIPVPPDHPAKPARTPAEKDRAFRNGLQHIHALLPEERNTLLQQLKTAHGIDALDLSARALLSWPEMATLARTDWISFGAHGVTHSPLRHLDEAQVRREMLDSKHRLEEMLGIPIRHFAYPYGNWATVSPREPVLARQCGFDSAVLSWGGPVLCRSNCHALPRIGFADRDSSIDLRLRLSGLRGWLKNALPHHRYERQEPQ
ncbi:MAG: polysaccharide deacetylase family protein [Magnetococcales bacterium]|nr:polysaccharide deacetylase family protein [Magnetococcales bacterium]